MSVHAIHYAVIIDAPKDAGNRAAAFIILDPEADANAPMKLMIDPPSKLLAAASPRIAIASAPVFELGEILLLNPDTGREWGGRGRKPGKWSVGWEVYDDPLHAAERSVQVVNASIDSTATGEAAVLPPPSRRPLRVHTTAEALERTRRLIDKVQSMSQEELEELGRPIREALERAQETGEPVVYVRSPTDKLMAEIEEKMEAERRTQSN